MIIESLSARSGWIERIAGWHFERWGPLTGCESLEDYTSMLRTYAEGRSIPRVLVAVSNERPLGTASLIASDMATHPDLTLNTSGDVPQFYNRLGWQACETTEYLGKSRMIMRHVFS